MKEIEVKILEIEVDNTIAKIIALGGIYKFDSELHAIYWDYPDYRLRNEKKLLRLRQEGTECILAMKTKINDDEVKIQDEIEVEVSNFNSTMMILINTGLIITKDTRKRRISYAIGKVKFDIDIYKGNLSHIPPFIEIEAESKTEIFKFAELLGFKKEQCLAWTTYELEANYAHLRSHIEE